MYSFCRQISLRSCHDNYKIHPKHQNMLLLHSLIGDAFVIWVFYNTLAGSCCRLRSYHCLVKAGFVLVRYEYGVWPVSSEGIVTPVSARSVCLWVVSMM